MLREGCEWNFEDQLNVALKSDCKYFLKIYLKEIFGRYLPHKGGLWEKRYFLLFFSARANWPTHKISDFSEPPFMFFANNFSNIWHIWSNPKIDHKMLTVWHHLKKKWTFFDEKWAHNDHLLLNISNSLYFHS